MTESAVVVHTGSGTLTGLADALDRLIGSGVAVAGDLVISVGGVDLVRVDLRALVATISTQDGAR